MSPLAFTGQEDFAAGMLRSTARGMEPGVGVFNAINGLFDDDGDCYLRGGTSRFSATDVPGSDKLLTNFWIGVLDGEQVMLVATTDRYFRVGVDGVWTALTAGPLQGWDATVKPAAVGGEVFFPNGAWFKTSPAYPGTITGAHPSGDGPGSWLPPHLTGVAANADVGTPYVCACANRLVLGRGRIIAFSSFDATGKPTPHVFGATDYHELPEGAVVTGIAAIRDTVLVFTNRGIWTITNLALDLTDDFGNPQQTLSKIIPDLSLGPSGQNGIAEWEGRLVAPCSDAVYLIDGISAPVAISNSIAPLYQDYILHYALGGAWTWANHYFLPLFGAEGAVAVLACRLNRPVRGRMTYYPWTRLEGEVGRTVVGDVSATGFVPEPLVVTDTGWILSLRDLFRIDFPAPLDADGTAPVFHLETRDFPTGNGQPNHVRELRAYYTLQSVDGITPLLFASMSFGDESYSLGLPPHVGASPGVDPAKWPLPEAKRARYVRAHLHCEDAVERLTIHRIQIGIRPATHQR